MVEFCGYYVSDGSLVKLMIKSKLCQSAEEIKLDVYTFPSF